MVDDNKDPLPSYQLTHEWIPHATPVTEEVFRFGLTPTISIWSIQVYHVSLLHCLKSLKCTGKYLPKRSNPPKNLLHGQKTTLLSLHYSIICAIVFKRTIRESFWHMSLLLNKSSAEHSCSSTSVQWANFAR
jgi:hypothetical protein